ncbi:MAG: hypothetical protein ACMXX9_00560 [Candidatus Woesearchaeota archaeon]
MRIKKLLLIILLTVFILPVVSADQILDVPIIGAVDVEQMPLFLATILIAGADGFNPCSIWVLLFLLGMIIHTKSRKKIALVGSVFLFTTAAVYGLFIAGIFTIFTFMNQLTSITYFVAILALIFGLVNVKDYFFYKKGISFTIPDKYKPEIFKKSRNLIREEKNHILIFSTIVMALGISIIELPCTAGLPLIWSGIITTTASSNFFWFLLLYLFVYLAIEIMILITVLITLKSFKMTEFKGRALKLIGGILIIALALILIIDSSLMYNMSYALLVVLGSILFSGLIILIERGAKKLK